MTTIELKFFTLSQHYLSLLKNYSRNLHTSIYDMRRFYEVISDIIIHLNYIAQLEGYPLIETLRFFEKFIVVPYIDCFDPRLIPLDLHGFAKENLYDMFESLYQNSDRLDLPVKHTENYMILISLQKYKLINYIL